VLRERGECFERRKEDEEVAREVGGRLDGTGELI
jgi:hypothetical protein